MPSRWRQMNQALTRRLMTTIGGLPGWAKEALGQVPVVSEITHWAMVWPDVYRWGILKIAERYDKDGKLNGASSRALASYKAALVAEQREYNRLLTALEKDDFKNK